MTVNALVFHPAKCGMESHHLVSSGQCQLRVIPSLEAERKLLLSHGGSIDAREPARTFLVDLSDAWRSIGKGYFLSILERIDGPPREVRL
jgi:hypothetical protein